MINDEFITIESSEAPQSPQRQESKNQNGKHKRKNPKEKMGQQDGSHSSSDFDESQCLPQNKQLLKLYDMKECQICNLSENPSYLLLCDQCDDGYHTYCLQTDVNREIQLFLCPRCKEDEIQVMKRIKQNQQSKIQQIQTNCKKCEKPLQVQKPQQVFYGCNFEAAQLYFQGQFQNQKCLHCKSTFHYQCFNIRTNALNCSACERLIRSKCPKGHKKFLQYFLNKNKKFNEHKYFTLTPLPKSQRQNNNKRQSKINLKLPSPVTNWQFITQYQASIYYAFQTKKLNFIQEQIYDDQEVMKLNKWNGQSTPLLQLSEEDEKVFEQFKENTTNGIIVGPYEIKQDRAKGFHIVATDFIEKKTIITEYVGEVVPTRKSLFHHRHNDSIFSLIMNSHSSLSVDIVPQYFGNISRFFSGINNNKSQSRKSLNLQAKKFSYKGRARIIFYAIKDIQAGDQLFCDYNGGMFSQYPTHNFKV